MQSRFSILRRAALWLRRIPYRQGYGIHSPWAFNLVTGVIYEKGNFYAYGDLHRQRTSALTREKDDRLLLRLANDFQPSRAIVWGGDAVSEPLRYLRAGCSSCDYRRMGKDDAELLRRTLDEWDGIDLLYIDDAERWRDIVGEVLPFSRARTCIIIRCVGGRARDDWRAIIADERVRVSFDLYYLGILCFDPRFAKQDYIINYT